MIASTLVVGLAETTGGVAGPPQGPAMKQGPASDEVGGSEDDGEGEGLFGALRPQQQAPSRHRMPQAHECGRPPPSLVLIVSA